MQDHCSSKNGKYSACVTHCMITADTFLQLSFLMIESGFMIVKYNSEGQKLAHIIQNLCTNISLNIHYCKIVAMSIK